MTTVSKSPTKFTIILPSCTSKHVGFYRSYYEKSAKTGMVFKFCAENTIVPELNHYPALKKASLLSERRRVKCFMQHNQKFPLTCPRKLEIKKNAARSCSFKKSSTKRSGEHLSRSSAKCLSIVVMHSFCLIVE